MAIVSYIYLLHCHNSMSGFVKHLCLALSLFHCQVLSCIRRKSKMSNFRCNMFNIRCHAIMSSSRCHNVIHKVLFNNVIHFNLHQKTKI